jgi:hypothetical protein
MAPLDWWNALVDWLRSLFWRTEMEVPFPRKESAVVDEDRSL